MTIKEILSLNPTERKNRYGVSGIYEDENGNYVDRKIDRVLIAGEEFTDFSAFSFLWEKSYVKSPVRSGDGSIGNLDSYATFLTPHLKIDFGLLSIDSYRKIMQLIYSKNEFVVTCYDIVNNKMTTNRMYFSTEEMPKLFMINRCLNGENWSELLGVESYVVEMIGTNASLEKVKVNYYLNYPSGGQTTPIFSEEFGIGEEIIIGDGVGIESEAPSGYKFTHWTLGSVNGTGYEDKTSFLVTKSAVNEKTNTIEFFAQWQYENSFTLLYNYGLSEKMISNNQYVESKIVEYGKSIGTLPTFTEKPEVELEENGVKTKYQPYKNGAWYKTPTKVKNSVPVANNEAYWTPQNSAIYLLYETEKYNAKIYIDKAFYSSVAVEYNASVPLPSMVKYGYLLDGWYTDSEYKNKFSGNMPPYPISLYARWVKQ